MKKLYIIILSSLFLSLGLKGQDIHFSHIHSTPLVLNPGMAGMFEGDLRLMADFRSQWKSVTTDYQTMYGAVDMKTRTFHGRNSAIAFGLEVFSDKAGDLDFRTYGSHFTLSGLKTLDGRNGKKLITAAAKIGVIGNSVDFSKIYAFDEEPEINNGIENSLVHLDMAIGLGWFHEMKKKKHMYYLGFSLAHITRPSVDFGLYTEDQPAEILYRRYVFHGGGDIFMSKSMNLMPSFIFMDQGPHKEITMGTFWKYRSGKTRIQKKKNLAIYLGLWGRWYFEFDGIAGFDAIIASLRLNMKKTSLTFSYDINTSSLSAASYGRGGPEISIIHIADWRRASQKVHCPVMN